MMVVAPGTADLEDDRRVETTLKLARRLQSLRLAHQGRQPILTGFFIGRAIKAYLGSLLFFGRCLGKFSGRNLGSPFGKFP